MKGMRQMRHIDKIIDIIISLWFISFIICLIAMMIFVIMEKSIVTFGYIIIGHVIIALIYLIYQIIDISLL